MTVADEEGEDLAAEWEAALGDDDDGADDDLASEWESMVGDDAGGGGGDLLGAVGGRRVHARSEPGRD